MSNSRRFLLSRVGRSYLFSSPDPTPNLIDLDERDGDDTQLFLDAITEAATIATEEHPVTITSSSGATYTIEEEIALTSHTRMRFPGAKFTAAYGLTTMFSSKTVVDNVHWYGGYFDGDGESVTLMDFNSPDSFHIESIRMHDFDTGINIKNGITDTRLTRATFTQGRVRCVYVPGTPTLSADNLELDHLVFRDIDQTGGTRRFMYVNADAALNHKNVNVHDVYARGPGTSYNNVDSPGTADQIVCNGVDNLNMSRIQSFDGGDLAIGVVDSNFVRLSDCYSEATDTAGFGLRDNTFLQANNLMARNCGQNRDLDDVGTPGTRPAWSRVGVSVNANTASDGVIINNAQMVDDQGVATMQYGLGIKTGPTNVTYGTIQSSGHVIAAIARGL